MKLRVVAPCGDVEVAGYGALTSGAVFIPRAADVPHLIGQVENFEPADAGAVKARAAYFAATGGATPSDTAGDTADDAPPTENEAH